MYITCEQCNTIFRLDENRLKPTGSKVRCCQCRNLFVAWPPAPTGTGPADARHMEDATAQYAAPSSNQQAEDTFDQELEGIDLAELDSILDQDQSEDFPAAGDDFGDRSMASAAAETGELDESDLDMDFESELALDDDRPADSITDAGEQALDEDFDLDMDFDLDAAAASEAADSPAEDQSIEDDLEMDFELGDDLDQPADAQEQHAQADTADEALDENIESVLDDFEDVLNEAADTEDETSPAGAEGEGGEIEEEIDLSDLEDVLETPDETGAANEDLDLDDIGAALDMPETEEDVVGEDDFDIDLSDLNMDLDEEPETAEEEAGSGNDADQVLDEDLTLDEAPAPSEDQPALEETPLSDDQEDDEVFDLSDLDGLMELDEEEEEAAEESGPGGEGTELSLDDLTLDEAPAPSEDQPALEETPLSDDQEDDEVFDLSDLDGLMELDEEEEEAAEESGPGDGGAELSLDEDLSLDIEEATAGTSSEAPTDDLDLSDLGGLDTMLDEDSQTEDSELEDLELSLDDEQEDGAAEDLELTLEMDDNADQSGSREAGQGDDDLDLGGLDSLLDEEDSADESELEDLELSLDDDGSEPTASDDLSLELSDDGKNEEAEDLEFSLDSEFEDKPGSDSDAGEAAGEDEELDLTDLEQMLENETLVPEPIPQDQESDLSLTGKDEKFTEKDAESLGLDSGAELDLSEIEAAIDSADEDKDDGEEEDMELELDLESHAVGEQELQEAPDDDLELDLEMESGAAGDAEGEVDDSQEAIDLSDLDLSLEDDKPNEENEVVNAGDIELEFQIEDEMEPATIDSAETMPGEVTTASYSSQTTVPADDDTSLIEEAFTEQPEATEKADKPVPEKKKQKKKGSSTALIVILILALLGGGGYFGYQYAVENNIEIPYLNDLIHPKPQDPSGIAMLTTMDINSKFIDNEKGGRIFVVTGKVRNGYSVPCNKIQLQGKLFTKGKVLAKTELAYAGVIINDLELAGQEVAQIKQRLKTGGGQTAELVVNPGQTLPFMVVFSELPADLDEFAIELLNSTKVQ